jgi:hypothetical protein
LNSPSRLDVLSQDFGWFAAAHRKASLVNIDTRLASALLGIFILNSSNSHAQAEPIGHATQVEPSVEARGAARRTLREGSDLESNDLIVTNAKGRAVFRFVDDTLLSLSANTQVKLDRFVFAGPTTAESFVLRATKGAFRFVSGTSPHGAYSIVTPTASIAVRGTEFDVAIVRDHVTVSVTAGSVQLCRVGGGAPAGGCAEAQPGQSIRSDAARVRVLPTSSLPRQPAGRFLPMSAPTRGPEQTGPRRSERQDLPVPNRPSGDRAAGGRPNGASGFGGPEGGSGAPGGGPAMGGGGFPGGAGFPGGGMPGGPPMGQPPRMGR